MDGSLGLQGTKPNFLGLADLGAGGGRQVVKAKARCGSYDDLISWDTSILCTSKVNLQKSIAVLEIEAAAPLNLCPSKVAAKECDFPYGIGTSSPSLQGHKRESVFNPWLLLNSPLLAQLYSCDRIMHLAKQSFGSGKSDISIYRWLNPRQVVVVFFFKY